ncbi:hypothetical protein BH24PSE2_BH24PSE2_13130 [soil metagenome]
MLINAARRVNAAIRTRRRRLANRRVARRLATTPGYVFTADYISRRTAVWQQHLAQFAGKAHVRLLEVGSFEGRSAIWFLENVLTHPTASMTCVDPFVWQGREPRFDHNIEVSGLADKVTKIKARSEEILGTLEEHSFDIAYIDGSHLAPNVMLDAMLTWMLLKPGGILLFDDYCWQPDRPLHERPKMAIDAFLKVLETQLEILHVGYQVIVKKSAHNREPSRQPMPEAPNPEAPAQP